MNGKIIELARQATGKQVVGGSDLGDWDVIEKLAELIIRECSQYADPTSSAYMLDHFGIEE